MSWSCHRPEIIIPAEVARGPIARRSMGLESQRRRLPARAPARASRPAGVPRLPSHRLPSPRVRHPSHRVWPSGTATSGPPSTSGTWPDSDWAGGLARRAPPLSSAAGPSRPGEIPPGTPGRHILALRPATHSIASVIGATRRAAARVPPPGGALQAAPPGVHGGSHTCQVSAPFTQG